MTATTVGSKRRRLRRSKTTLSKLITGMLLEEACFAMQIPTYSAEFLDVHASLEKVRMTTFTIWKTEEDTKLRNSLLQASTRGSLESRANMTEKEFASGSGKQVTSKRSVFSITKK